MGYRLPEARWLVVGRGYFGEEESLARRARTEGLAEKLVFAGWVSPDDLPHYFAAANVAFHPYEDNLINRTKCSVKLLDLLSAGVPVVATRVGQNTETIWQGKTGLLIPPGRPDVAAQALIYVLTHPNVQQAFAQEAPRHVRRVFHWDTLAQKVEAAYLL